MFNRGLIDDLRAEIKELKDNCEKWKLECEQRKEQHETLNKKYIEALDAENRFKKKFEEEKALAYKTMELEFKGKAMEEVQKVKSEADARIQKGIEENFAKLKDSLAKLHEEGNAQTKFTEQIALKMMGALKPSGIPALEEK